MRISDWSSDVCSSDLRIQHAQRGCLAGAVGPEQAGDFTVARLEADIVDRDHGGLVLALAGEGLAEVFGNDHGIRDWGLGIWKSGRAIGKSDSFRAPSNPESRIPNPGFMAPTR